MGSSGAGGGDALSASGDDARSDRVGGCNDTSVLAEFGCAMHACETGRSRLLRRRVGWDGLRGVRLSICGVVGCEMTAKEGMNDIFVTGDAELI